MLFVVTISHSLSRCRPLGQFDDLTNFHHFCQSSSYLTQDVAPIPVHCAMSVSRDLFAFPRTLLHAPRNHASHHVQANRASWWHGQTINVSSYTLLPEAVHTSHTQLSVSPIHDWAIVIEHCIVLQHARIQKKASKYIKYLCADDAATLVLWTTAIRVAKVMFSSYLTHSTDSVYSAANEYRHCREGTRDGLVSCPGESVQLHSNCLR